MRFTLKDYDVRATSATVFAKGNCRDLRDDREIVLTGVLEGTKSILATRIEIKK